MTILRPSLDWREDAFGHTQHPVNDAVDFALGPFGSPDWKRHPALNRTVSRGAGSTASAERELNKIKTTTRSGPLVRRKRADTAGRALDSARLILGRIVNTNGCRI